MTNPLPFESFQEKGLSFLRASVLGPIPGLEHAFTRRRGGLSPPPFKGLNFGGDDKPSNIKANKELLSHAFTLSQGGVVTVRQVHGRHVVVIGGAGDNFIGRERDKSPEGDAIVTSQKGLAIGVLTADCVPVLFYDAVTATIAVAHAGWRGFVAGVLKETIEAMGRGFGVHAGDILVAIGPHIGPCCYEVSEDLLSEFHESGRETRPYFAPEGGKGKLHLDLGRAVSDELKACGLSAGHISAPGPCTFCDRGFYSYRRDAVTGRQLSFIVMR